MPVPPAARRDLRVTPWAALTSMVLLAGCASGAPTAAEPAALKASTSAAAAVSPAPSATPAPAQARPPVEIAVTALGERLRPDVLVTADAPLSPEAVAQLTALSGEAGAVVFRTGTVKVAGRDVAAVAVDPSAFRIFAAQGTAESDAVWQAVARGEAVVSHEGAEAQSLELGKGVGVAPAAGGAELPLRVGALATTGVPGSDLVLGDAVGASLGLPAATGLLITAAKGQDPVALAGQVERIVAGAGKVDLLSPPAANPVAFLTGSKAAEALGAFSYRYFPDGTIEPDAAWVRENIQTATLPIVGRVTCHRLMIPQLRGALQEVVDVGLASTLNSYDGCYVPRFIERNPENSISLHTWGIAIDMDAATNYRGIRGTMHPEVVSIFKRWGFRWGGDWTYTDPMHFELAALLP